MDAVVEKKRGISELTLDQITALRNRLSAEIKAQDAIVSELKEKRLKIDAEILRRFNEQGLSSARTNAGTPYIIERTSVSIADKDAFMSWMEENNAYDFMEVRASKTMVETYKNEHNDLPPGLNWSSALTIGVKKS